MSISVLSTPGVSPAPGDASRRPGEGEGEYAYLPPPFFFFSKQCNQRSTSTSSMYVLQPHPTHPYNLKTYCISSMYPSFPLSCFSNSSFSRRQVFTSITYITQTLTPQALALVFSYGIAYCCQPTAISSLTTSSSTSVTINDVQDHHLPRYSYTKSVHMTA